MARVKLGLFGLTPDETVSLANQIKTAMTGNAHFPSPSPTLATLGTAITTATTKVAAQKAAQLAAKQATDDRDAAIEALNVILTALASHVDSIALGDKVIIESAGMNVKATAAPQGALPQVQNLSIISGDSEGQLDLQWDPVTGAKGYEIQMTTDPNVASSWTMVASCSGSRWSLEGLTSGQKVWVRVRAKAPKKQNFGPWSDPATKVVP